MAEYLAMAMLTVAKGLPALLAQKSRGEWVKPSESRELFGSRALLIGFGDVGRAVWQRLAAFGVTTTAVRRRPAPEEGIEVVGPADWRARLGEFDWVVVTTPLTVDTRRLIGSAELSVMKPDAWLVNISRGGVVDQGALTQALRQKVIGGAFLDVTEPEPLPPGDELWSLPNAIITPHCSWLSPSFVERAGRLFLENLTRWRAGDRLQNVVDLELGY
jgi:phosphoglycerate dehydrogenase-like enzyme